MIHKPKEFKPFRILIYSDAHFTNVQKVLFKLGYKWLHIGDTIINPFTSPYVFTCTNGRITKSHSKLSFKNKKQHTLVNLDDLVELHNMGVNNG